MLNFNELIHEKQGAETMPEVERIGLQEAVATLRKEIEEAIQFGQDEDLQFELGEINLELQVEFERSAEVTGSAGIKVFVAELFNIEGKAAASRRKTHTVSIPLKPIIRDKQANETGAVRVSRGGR